MKPLAREADPSLPATYGSYADTSKVTLPLLKDFFKDAHLMALIDSALVNNQELNIALQNIELDRNEVLAKKGEYLPLGTIGLGLGQEKSAEYTREGAVEKQLSVKDGKEFPEPLQDFVVSTNASWEVDLWRKLRNAKDAAAYRLLATTEGKNYIVTQLVAEIAERYYELMALDNLLATINDNIVIQQQALRSVKLQKESARATQLAVNRFEAQLLNTQNLQYQINQKIIESENRLRFLTGSFTLNIDRNSEMFLSLSNESVLTGIPAQMLENRPDIRRAQWELEASKLDVKVARANFYPRLDLKAGIGFRAFDPSFLISPESLVYNIAGDLLAPLVNRKGIKAAYNSANARQLQAVYDYEQTILNAYVEVQNQLNKVENYAQSYEVKSKEVQILEQSVKIANSLFNAARADYVEVLLTQEEVLAAKLEWIEVKAKIMEGKVNLYRALGGGWQ